MGLYRRIVWGNLQGHRDPLWLVLDDGKQHSQLTECVAQRLAKERDTDGA